MDFIVARGLINKFSQLSPGSLFIVWVSAMKQASHTHKLFKLRRKKGTGGRSTFISLTAVECVRWTHSIKIERNNLLCEQAPTEVFRSIFAWLVTFNFTKDSGAIPS